MSAHWTDEELLSRLYGVGPEEAARAEHLSVCAECSARWRRLEESRGRILESAQLAVVDDARLRAQRDAVWRRLEESRRPWIWRIVPAGATAALVLVAVLLNTPAPRIEPADVASVHQISDEQLFNEIASMVNEEAPRAAKTIQGLFDAEAAVEVR